MSRFLDAEEAVSKVCVKEDYAVTHLCSAWSYTHMLG